MSSISTRGTSIGIRKIVPSSWLDIYWFRQTVKDREQWLPGPGWGEPGSACCLMAVANKMFFALRSEGWNGYWQKNQMLYHRGKWKAGGPFRSSPGLGCWWGLLDWSQQTLFRTGKLAWRGMSGFDEKNQWSVERHFCFSFQFVSPSLVWYPLLATTSNPSCLV